MHQKIIEAIQEAHKLVKSGADFPILFNTLKLLGIRSATTFVKNGNVIYHMDTGNIIDNQNIVNQEIQTKLDRKLFVTELKRHQSGKTNYLEFLHMCASAGINHWTLNFLDNSCTYYDQQEKVVFQEIISINK